MGDVWTDIAPLNSQAAERLGFQTQKPEALLDRITEASTDPGDVVLDPFCGCGSAVASAHRLQRRWIGIDITFLARYLVEQRLVNRFGSEVKKTYVTVGEPTSLDDAARLAAEDPYQFQWWALGLVGARRDDQKKGADKGIDGRLLFHDEGPRARTKQIIISVKAGMNVGRREVHELRGVIDRERADIGVLISMKRPTRPMREEAATAGFYESPWGKHPRIQLITVEDLLGGRAIDYPKAAANVTVQRAPRYRKPRADQQELALLTKHEGGASAQKPAVRVQTAARRSTRKRA